MTAVTSPSDLDRQVASLPPLGLDDLAGPDPAQGRFDVKYLVGVHRLPEVVDAVADGMAVLEVDGRRASHQTTTYFDTPGLYTFRAHLQGRRRRFKVRTRHYGNPAATWLEVKLKGRRGRTIKHRRPHAHHDPTCLDAVGHAFVAATLRDAYDLPVPDGLGPSATTTYLRTTLADLDRGERLSIDRALAVTVDGQRIAFDPELAIVEVKGAEEPRRLHRALHAIGLREGALSKYCLGLAAARPDLPANPWRPTLRRILAEPTPHIGLHRDVG